MEFVAYTDGFLADNLMGLGWILMNKEESRTIAKYKAANVNFPSLTKAELIAIFSLLITLKKNISIEIKTDSNNSINSINGYNELMTDRKRLKNKHYRILENIDFIWKKLDLNLKLTKVKAHEGILGNEEVDILAKEGRTENVFKNNKLLGENITDR